MDRRDIQIPPVFYMTFFASARRFSPGPRAWLKREESLLEERRACLKREESLLEERGELARRERRACSKREESLLKERGELAQRERRACLKREESLLEERGEIVVTTSKTMRLFYEE